MAVRDDYTVNNYYYNDQGKWEPINFIVTQPADDIEELKAKIKSLEENLKEKELTNTLLRDTIKILNETAQPLLKRAEAAEAKLEELQN